MSYFTPRQRRDALLLWLRRQYGERGMFNTDEASAALDIFTPLYGRGFGETRKCGRDLGQLRREGWVERVGSQWRLTSDAKT